MFGGVGRLSGMAVAVGCGQSDPFYAATRHLVSLMNFPHETFFGPGLHNVGFWRSIARMQLSAIAPALGIPSKS